MDAHLFFGTWQFSMSQKMPIGGRWLADFLLFLLRLLMIFPSLTELSEAQLTLEELFSLLHKRLSLVDNLSNVYFNLGLPHLNLVKFRPDRSRSWSESDFFESVELAPDKYIFVCVTTGHATTQLSSVIV